MARTFSQAMCRFMQSGGGNLLATGRVLGILCRGGKGQGSECDSKAKCAKHRSSVSLEVLNFRSESGRYDVLGEERVHFGS